MLVDARTVSVDEVVDTEVCIIGAGPAGITLAREFIGQDFRVCLLESGRTEPPDQELQSLCEGEITGDIYQDLSKSRWRQFGGTANLWLDHTGDKHYSVRFLPLDKIDFEKRDWLPYSGWPFDKFHLDPFYERAHYICRLRPFAYDAEDWEDEQTPRLPLAGEQIATTVYQFAPRNVFTHEIPAQINRASNITTYLNANVVELETDNTKTVNRVRVACLQGNQFWVRAKIFILATAGIENARLLLLSNKAQNVGLGNQNDLVGRFFMEHPIFRFGVFRPANRQLFNLAGLYDLHWANNLIVMGKLSLTEEVMRRRQLLNSYMMLIPRSIYRDESTALKSLKLLLSSIRQAKIPKDALKQLSDGISGDDIMTRIYRRAFKLEEERYTVSKGGWSRYQDNESRFSAFEVWAITEQKPNPDIRVTLGDECDRFGLRKIQPLRWCWSDLEINSIQQTQEILREEIEGAGLGQFHSSVELNRSVGGRHQIGTTRMHIDPKQGVVDENCQVHGVSNLFIAGSSVFPTQGAANPTLTIIALAIRLADRVKKVMAPAAVVKVDEQPLLVQ